MAHPFFFNILTSLPLRRLNSLNLDFTEPRIYGTPPAPVPRRRPQSLTPPDRQRRSRHPSHPLGSISEFPMPGSMVLRLLIGWRLVF